MRTRCASRHWLGGLCLLLLTLSGCGLTDWYLPAQSGSGGAMGMPAGMIAFNDGTPPLPDFNVPPDFNFPGGSP